MNILIVNSEYTGGGAEKVARQLFCGLTQNEDINTFFIVGRTFQSNEAITGIYNYNKVSVRLINRTKNLFSDNARRKDHYSKNIILSYIKKYSIDIVHFHNIHGNYIGIKDIGEISKHCKVVWTLHDMWALTGHCAYPLGCDKWIRNGCQQCLNLNLYPKMFIDKAHSTYKTKKDGFTKKDITFVVPSKWLMDQCNKTFLVKEKKFLIYNGVDINKFYPLDKKKIREKYHISNEKIVIMFGANSIDNPYKGTDILENALSFIKEKEKYELVIIGNGKHRSLSVFCQCHYTGYISTDEKMNELYNLADVFILPSRAENFPCSILECMAAGTPVIASKAGGIIEQVDEKTGWLFDIGDAVQLAEIINEVLNKKEVLLNMGILCRKKVVEQFSEIKMLQEYKKLYEYLLCNKNKEK